MAATEVRLRTQLSRTGREGWAILYAWCVALAGLALAVHSLGEMGDTGIAAVVPWVVAALVGDALAVRFSGSVALSLSLPVTLAAAFVLPPSLVGLVGFLGVWQLPGRTWRYLTFSLFNRAEVALAAVAGALVIQALGGAEVAWPALVLVAAGGLFADSVVNLVLMLPIVLLREGSSLTTAIRTFFGSRPLATLASYGSAGLAAPVLLVAWEGAGLWGLVSALVCVALAGLGLRSSQKWGEAESALTTAQALVREGTSQIALERRDERRTLAAELHDEVLPAMFKVHLMGEVIRRDLEAGRLLELDEDVLGLLGATGQAQDAVRQVVGGLRGSSVGVRGLSASVRSLCDRLSLDGPSLQVQISDVDLGDRAQTVAYQVVREALTNAAKYARASAVRVEVRQEASRTLRVTVSDDGCGFDVDEGLARPDHFGLALMRERVMAVGGELQIESRFGAGTLIWATIPNA